MVKDVSKMVFVLYKVCHKDSTICITEVFENEADAKDKMKLLTDEKTPEESLEESFTIQESFYTRTEQYNFKEPPFKYSEEDNSVDETDLESTTQSLRKRKHDSLDFENHIENHIEKVIVEVSKRVAENDNTLIYMYIYLCFVILVFLIFTIAISIRYIP
jgi:hypothetical protein